MINLLEVKNLCKFYNDDFSLKNINFTLSKGEVHGVIGENGSGKTCFMKNLCGYEPFDSGQVFVEKELLHNNKLLSRDILFIMQEPTLFNNLTVAENILFDKYNSKGKHFVNNYKLLSEAYTVLKDLSINLDAEALVGDLNFAQKQLVEVAKAYVSDCKIIIFDEPATTFTDYESNILFEVIKYLQNKGIGVIFISHKLQDIRRIADRISIFSKGEIVACREMKNFSDKEILSTMVSRPINYQYPKLNTPKGKVILELNDISSGNVLKDISLTLRSGEIVGVTGLMGSGRTYLSNYIYGSICENSISKLFDEKDVSIKSTSEAIEKGIAMLPENRDLVTFKGQNALFNTTISSLNRFNTYHGLLDELLESSAQSNFAKLLVTPNNIFRDIDSFSGGNLQKILLLRLLMTNALLYILDEPTRGIDIPTRLDIYNCMNDIVSKGGGILFLSSNIDELIGMSDRILVLEGGRIVAEVVPNKTTKEEILAFAVGKTDL